LFILIESAYHLPDFQNGQSTDTAEQNPAIAGKLENISWPDLILLKRGIVSSVGAHDENALSS